MQEPVLQALRSTGQVSALDIQFAGFIERLDGGDKPELAFAAALASSFTRQGHICISLKRLEELRKEIQAPGFDVPDWRGVLLDSGVVGAPGDFKPLVLDDAGRLYLYRYWEYQKDLADALRARVDMPISTPDPAVMKQMLDELFELGEAVDWQKIAVFSALRNRFCVISGGPGTGKTTTVAKLLAVLIELAAPEKLRIALAAPTGKAAARLKETLKVSVGRLRCPEAARAAVPQEASTIHRLLGFVPGSPYFRHDKEKKLPLDVLIVDEASMVDLALMSKLVEALPENARLILLGDMDQLASVEAGAVLGDICETGSRIPFSAAFADAVETTCGSLLDTEDRTAGPERTKDCVVQLRKSYRFGVGISAFSRAVRDREDEAALSILGSGEFEDLAWRQLANPGRLAAELKDEIVAGYRAYLEKISTLHTEGDPHARIGEVFRAFEEFRILCALREGPFGVSMLNTMTEKLLFEERLLPRPKGWYHGRPVIVMRNDYGLHLFNGDVGIYLPDIVSGSGSRVFFPGEEGRYRSFHPLRLPQHETVYAMTVHKSQGSEFGKVLFILPDSHSPILTRELVYTGVTRAKQRVTVVGTEEIIRKAISRSTERLSGLSDELWGREGIPSIRPPKRIGA